MPIFDGSAELQSVRCTDAIGKNIVCEDGKTRRVVEIVPSHAFPWMSVINENDPDSNLGHFVHNLSLACQLQGKPLPTQEMKEAFAKFCKALDYNEPSNRQERRNILRKLNRQPGRFWLR